MENVSQIEQSLKQILEERANVLARETGCIERQRKFSGADLVQTLVFGWLSHPDASLEMLASTAAIREVYVSDTAVHNRFNESCARFLHAVLEEMVSVLVHAEQPVPLELLHRFSSVVLEDSSSITLPKELADCWQGSGGGLGGGEAAIKLHVRWDLTHGQLFGPRLTDGRVSDQCSPFRQMSLSAGSLYIADLGYFDLDAAMERRKAGSYTLTRARSNTAFFTEQGKRLRLQSVLPQRVGQTKEMHVLVGNEQRYRMRLLMLRVPEEVAEQRRQDLRADATRRGRVVSQHALALADWTILLTDAPSKRLSLEEALILLRERWQMEMLYKVWKQYGQIDEWRTTHSWRVLCELYAKLIGMVLQQWLMVLFAWQNAQRSLVKLAQVVRDTAWTLMEALAGQREFSTALRVIERRMRVGCSMNTRYKHPNSAQLLKNGLNWSISP
jgi:DDE family transposase